MSKDKEEYNEYHRKYRGQKKQEKIESEEDKGGVTLAGYPDYLIFDDGKIYSKLNMKYLSLQERGGYYYIRLMRINKEGERKRGSKGVHILVARAFIPNPDNLPIVNHKDGDSFNNNVSNLEWVSHRRSIKHAYETGLIKSYKRPVLQYEKDGTFVKRYESVKEASEAMGCHRTTIGQICGGKKGKKTAKGYVWKFEKELEFPPDKDDEVWVSVKDHEDYNISNYGRIYTFKTKRLLKQRVRKDGYVRIGLDGEHYYVHVLVAKSFLGNPPKHLIKPEVNHKDGVKHNNRLSNLEWTDDEGNRQHAHDTGLNSTCKPVIQYSLTGEKIKGYKSVASAAKVMGISHTAILMACNKRHSTTKDFIWRFTLEPFDLKELKTMTTAKTRIVQYSLDGDKLKVWPSVGAASKEVGVHSSTLSKACSGKSKTSAGFIWRYEGNPPPTQKEKANNNRRVRQLDKDTGEVIKVWDTIKVAGDTLKISGSHITCVCKGRRITTGGFKWEYVE